MSNQNNMREEVKSREESKIEATPIEKKEPEQVPLFAMKKPAAPKVDDEEGKVNEPVKNVEQQKQSTLFAMQAAHTKSKTKSTEEQKVSSKLDSPRQHKSS